MRLYPVVVVVESDATIERRIEYASDRRAEAESWRRAETWLRCATTMSVAVIAESVAMIPTAIPISISNCPPDARLRRRVSKAAF